MQYYTILQYIHHCFRPNNYIEIGVRNGESLALAGAATYVYGVDPAPDITSKLSTISSIYACTSDEFFERIDIASEVQLPLDLSFIDGMHLFEYSLRDFINLEKLCHKGSIIILHDTFPKDAEMAARDRKTRVWCGDVFKLYVILKKYRPELELLHLDSGPSGLCLVKNLNPASTVLKDNYDKIVEEYMDFDFDFSMGNILSSLHVVTTTRKKLDEFIVPCETRRVTLKDAKTLPVTAQRIFTKTKNPNKIKMLGVLLCYNDADVLGDTIEYLLSQNHDLIVWDHGSTDETANVLNKYNTYFMERSFIERKVNFYLLYKLMSQRLINTHIKNYDIISWPDQDEFLEGPFRDQSYYEYLLNFYDSPYSWIRFNNMNYWYSKEDDSSIENTVDRIKHYSIFPGSSPRIRAWKAKVTNMREFNHNDLASGIECPVRFNLRHYPFRSHEQMMRRIYVDRADIQAGDQNYHYNSMKHRIGMLENFDVQKMLHKDDGEELNRSAKYDWSQIYSALE